MNALEPADQKEMKTMAAKVTAVSDLAHDHEVASCRGLVAGGIVHESTVFLKGSKYVADASPYAYVYNYRERATYSEPSKS